MRKKTHAVVAALAIAIAFAPMPELQAAGLVDPGSKPQVESLAQVVKAKRHRHKHKGRHARSKGPGQCGENMYWSRKGRGCMDARNKA
jgi:hypothetical protein